MSRFVSGGETTGKVLRRMVVWGAGVGCGGSAGRRTEKLERTEELKTNGNWRRLVWSEVSSSKVKRQRKQSASRLAVVVRQKKRTREVRGSTEKNVLM